MQRIITTAILIIVFGGVLLTSGYFYDELNDMKRWFLIVGSLILLIVCSLVPKGFSSLSRAIRSQMLCVGMSTIGLALAVQGIMQYMHVIASHNAYFPITGSFENPAGFAAAVCLMFPFAIHLMIHRECQLWHKLSGATAAAMMVTSVVMSQSRCGILALCMILAVMLAGMSGVRRNISKYRYLLLVVAVILVPCLLYALYNMKPDSANGRLFVWQVCLDMIRQRPLMGYGPSGFLTHYMPAQADYFAFHPDSPYIMLADNITHPFNEYVKLTVEYGFIGLLVSLLLLAALIRGAWLGGGNMRMVALAIVSALFVLCLFSYPFNYAISWFMTALLLLYATPKSLRRWLKRRYVRIVMSVVFMSLLSYSLYNMYYELKWAAISRRSLAGHTEQMLPHYEHMLPHMKDNHLFLYNYAADLNYIGRYDESLNITEACMRRCQDYDVQMLLADNLEHTGMTDSAIVAYYAASLMIPSRLIPLESLMNVYLSRADTLKADSIAQMILNKDVKVPSALTDEIIEKAVQTRRHEYRMHTN